MRQQDTDAPAAPADMNRRVWALAGPIILSNITVPLIGVVDTAVVGHLSSPHYIGAVAVGALVFNYLFWSFGFLRMGLSGLARYSPSMAGLSGWATHARRWRCRS